MRLKTGRGRRSFSDVKNVKNVKEDGELGLQGERDGMKWFTLHAGLYTCSTRLGSDCGCLPHRRTRLSV